MSAAEMREALKPCPFCGAPAGKPRKITADERIGYQETVTISCGKGCGAVVGVNGSLNKAGWSDAAAGATEAAAIAAWNRRAPLPNEEGAVERVGVAALQILFHLRETKWTVGPIHDDEPELWAAIVKEAGTAAIAARRGEK